MAKLDKLIRSIRNNPRDVRIDDAIKVAKSLGFSASGGKGRHQALSRPGDPVQLNFQPKGDGKIPPYQARQLIQKIEQYYDNDEGEGDDESD